MIVRRKKPHLMLGLLAFQDLPGLLGALLRLVAQLLEKGYQFLVASGLGILAVGVIGLFRLQRIMERADQIIVEVVNRGRCLSLLHVYSPLKGKICITSRNPEGNFTGYRRFSGKLCSCPETFLGEASELAHF